MIFAVDFIQINSNNQNNLPNSTNIICHKTFSSFSCADFDGKCMQTWWSVSDKINKAWWSWQTNHSDFLLPLKQADWRRSDFRQKLNPSAESQNFIRLRLVFLFQFQIQIQNYATFYIHLMFWVLLLKLQKCVDLLLLLIYLCLNPANSKAK